MSQSETTDVSKQRLRVWLGLLRVQRSVSNRLRDELRTRHDSTLPRFDVLATLDRYRDGLRMSELSAALKVSNGNVTGIIDRLVNEGLVTRKLVDGDRRAMLVKLTPDGLERFARMADEHETWINEMLCGLGQEDLDKMLDLLARIGKEDT